MGHKQWWFGMTHWWCKRLGDAITAEPACEAMRMAFAKAHAAAGYSSGMAMFRRSELAGGVQCEVSVYFSPEAGELARRFAAMPCNPPAPGTLELLAGLPACWARLFPDDSPSPESGPADST